MRMIEVEITLVQRLAGAGSTWGTFAESAMPSPDIRYTLPYLKP